MRIRIKTGRHSFCLAIPTGLIFGKLSAWLYLKFVRKTCSVAGQYMPDNMMDYGGISWENLPDHAIYAFCEELRRIKKRKGSWVLLDVESASGERVKITL